MRTYYEEIKEILKNDKEVKNFLASVRKIREELDFSEHLEQRVDIVGSHNQEEARRNVLKNQDEVWIALSWGHQEALELFEAFVDLVEEGYLDINKMELTLESWLEHDFNRQYIISMFEKIKVLNFQALETITKRNLIFKVLIDLENDEI